MLNQDEVPCPECGAFGPHMHNNTKPVAVAMPEVLLHYLKEERQWLTVQESEARQNAREAVAEGVRAACNARAGAMLEAIMAIDRAIARAAAKVSQEPAVDRSATAWLIEQKPPQGGSPSWFTAKNGCLFGTANQAIRFARKQDAEQFIRSWNNWLDVPQLIDVVVTEHAWIPLSDGTGGVSPMSVPAMETIGSDWDDTVCMGDEPKYETVDRSEVERQIAEALHHSRAWDARASDDETQTMAKIILALLPAQAPAQGDRTPNPDEVICPGCTHQFRAIPENVQRELNALRDMDEKAQGDENAKLRRLKDEFALREASIGTRTDITSVAVVRSVK